ncbi:DUF748 domain-containing protein [Leeuwenhoekiella sp. A16]|uniref:DUF748 domain-containing protein n=1 Tax=unclassified Leeuwenhoekiella TaxID=2615029 RepID=UPI003A80D9AF|tara:strand:- start:180040 stop:181245 length:1206 start_codon:yes stop_codon:yes gene_type:complete
MSATKSDKKRRGLKKKRYVLPVIIILMLVIFRILLPTIVKNYVNKVLADIPGYYGQVKDIDIALYRGAYVIDGMYLNKVNAKTQVPFLNFPETDISIEWKSIFKGRIVSEIKMYSPEVTYVFEDQEAPTEEGEADTEDWSAALTDLVPIDINHFEVHDGKLGFVKLQTEPDIDLYMDKLELTADNLRNVRDDSKNLPSPITARAVSIGKGNFKLNGGVNLIKSIPDMDLNFSLEDADITAFNDLTRTYAGIDFKEGDAAVYGEFAIADGYLKGYVKPMLSNSKMISKEDGILGTIWEGFVGMFKFVLKNQGTNTLATVVPLEGNLNNVQAGIFPTILNIFENAWINAFKGEIDEDIDYQDAIEEADLDNMSSKERREYKRAQRKAEREERREERKNDTTLP